MNITLDIFQASSMLIYRFKNSQYMNKLSNTSYITYEI